MNELLVKQAEAFIEDETFDIAILSNLSALLNEVLEDINWVGFYIYRDEHLILGPFQGKPACVHLYPGKGVCSHALETKQTTIVDDVHLFPGHIACDSASESELVVPIYVHGKPYGVLDIDAPIKARFTKSDAETMEAIIASLVNHLETIIPA